MAACVPSKPRKARTSDSRFPWPPLRRSTSTGSWRPLPCKVKDGKVTKEIELSVRHGRGQVLQTRRPAPRFDSRGISRMLPFPAAIRVITRVRGPKEMQYYGRFAQADHLRVRGPVTFLGTTTAYRAPHGFEHSASGPVPLVFPEAPRVGTRDGDEKTPTIPECSSGQARGFSGIRGRLSRWLSYRETPRA
jgi:hypothetical protein